MLLGLVHRPFVIEPLPVALRVLEPKAVASLMPLGRLLVELGQRMPVVAHLLLSGRLGGPVRMHKRSSMSASVVVMWPFRCVSATKAR
jgi:hypothetical protein